VSGVLASRAVPNVRVRALNGGEVRADGDFVLYWMVASRRTRWNHALDRAIELARRLRRPLLVLEGLRCDYPWATERAHAAVLAGMADNARAFAGSPVHYHPYVEPRPGAGRGLLRSLGKRACVVVTDDCPGSVSARLLPAAAEQLAVRCEAVDSSGLLPDASTPRAFARAVDFRRFLQCELPSHWSRLPRARPLVRLELPRLEELPTGLRRRWAAAGDELLAARPAALARLPLDHDVAPLAGASGPRRAEADLRTFLDGRLEAYGRERNHPDAEGTSGLSAHLHFGHLSAQEVFDRLARHEGWTPPVNPGAATGSRAGWWGMSASAEDFLEELVTWRELGLNGAKHRSDFERYESLPGWARETLARHATDPRPHRYTLEDFRHAGTHDELWNAAQRELSQSGRMHGYLRMLWGKKILHWSADPREALDVMVELNNRLALDGRDANSYAGILWVLGRYDRAWGPERDVFGKVRYMSSVNTRRKLRLRRYLERWQATPTPLGPS